MESPKTLLEAVKFYSDEQLCIDTVAQMRWPNGVRCPDCNTGDPYYIKTQKRWKCRDCRRQFSVKVGTIFEDSPISLTKWLPALWLIVNCKNGISSYEVARDLGVTQKTAWFMDHRLRLVMKAKDLGTKIGSNNGGEVEVDEGYFGGKVEYMHKSRVSEIAKTTKELTGKDVQVRFSNKTAVIGMLDRETREIRTKVIPNTKRETLESTIRKNVKFGSRIYTDQAVAYRTLRHKYVHDTVNHAEAYVKGRVHTNGLENFWSLTKRQLAGTYVAVEPEHLTRYLDEQMFRYNNRSTPNKPMNDYDRFKLALSQVANRRLTYAELIGKTQDGAGKRAEF